MPHLICTLSLAAEHILPSTQPSWNRHWQNLSRTHFQRSHDIYVNWKSVLLSSDVLNACKSCSLKLSTTLHTSLSLAGRLGVELHWNGVFLPFSACCKVSAYIKVRERRKQRNLCSGEISQACWPSKLHTNNFHVIVWHASWGAEGTWNSVSYVRINNSTTQIPQLHHRTSQEGPSTAYSHHMADKSWMQDLACLSQ